MSKTHCDISMSLDGFITGPNEGVGNPLGDDNGALHDWMFAAGVDADAEVLAELYETSGAILMGRRMFDVGFEPWGDPPPFGMPVFVVTHEPQEPMQMQGGTTYTFVSSGIEDALAQAKAAAGDKNVAIFGGAGIFQTYLRAGLVDELQIHLPGPAASWGSSVRPARPSTDQAAEDPGDRDAECDASSARGPEMKRQ